MREWTLFVFMFMFYKDGTKVSKSHTEAAISEHFSTVNLKNEHKWKKRALSELEILLKLRAHSCLLLLLFQYFPIFLSIFEVHNPSP